MNVASTALSEAYGWSMSLVTGIITLANIANVVVGFIAGRVCAKGSAKKIGVTLGIIYVGGILVMGALTDLLVFAVCYILANSSAAAWGYNANPVMLAHWFPRKKGVVLGLSSIGIPFAAGTAPIIYSLSLDVLGVRWALLPFALIGVLSLALLFMLADDPVEIGLYPDNDPTPLANGDAEAAETATTLAAATEGRGGVSTVLVLAVTLGVEFLFCSGLSVQLVPMLTSCGIPSEQATLLMLIMAALAIVGSYVCGLADTRFGARKATMATFVVSAVSMLCIATGTPAGALIGLALIGVCIGAGDNWPMSLCIEHYGATGFAAAYGVIFPVIQLIGAFGAVFFAAPAEALGGYTVPCLLMAAMLVVSLIVFKRRIASDKNW